MSQIIAMPEHYDEKQGKFYRIRVSVATEDDRTYGIFITDPEDNEMVLVEGGMQLLSLIKCLSEQYRVGQKRRAEYVARAAAAPLIDGSDED